MSYPGNYGQPNPDVPQPWQPPASGVPYQSQQHQVELYRPQQPVYPVPQGYYPPVPMPMPMPQYGYPMVVPRPNSGMCTTSLVLGILSLVMPCSFGLFPLAAIIFGHVGLAQTKDGTVGGRGMGVAGLVMGYIMFVPIIILSVFLLGFMGLAAA